MNSGVNPKLLTRTANKALSTFQRFHSASSPAAFTVADEEMTISLTLSPSAADQLEEQIDDLCKGLEPSRKKTRVEKPFSDTQMALIDPSMSRQNQKKMREYFEKASNPVLRSMPGIRFQREADGLPKGFVLRTVQEPLADNPDEVDESRELVFLREDEPPIPKGEVLALCLGSLKCLKKAKADTQELSVWYLSPYESTEEDGDLIVLEYDRESDPFTVCVGYAGRGEGNVGYKYVKVIENDVPTIQVVYRATKEIRPGDPLVLEMNSSEYSVLPSDAEAYKKYVIDDDDEKEEFPRSSSSKAEALDDSDQEVDDFAPAASSSSRSVAAIVPKRVVGKPAPVTRSSSMAAAAIVPKRVVGNPAPAASSSSRAVFASAPDTSVAPARDSIQASLYLQYKPESEDDDFPHDPSTFPLVASMPGEKRSLSDKVIKNISLHAWHTLTGLFENTCIALKLNDRDTTRETFICEFTQICNEYLVTTRMDSSYRKVFITQFDQYVAHIRDGNDTVPPYCRITEKSRKRFDNLIIYFSELSLIAGGEIKLLMDQIYVRNPNWNQFVKDLFQLLSGLNVDLNKFNEIADLIQGSFRYSFYRQIKIRFQGIPGSDCFAKKFTYEKFMLWKQAKEKELE